MGVTLGLQFREHLDLRTMKLTFCNVFLVLAMVDLGEAQFFGVGSISATQNCLNSNCNQNNFRRKRRQVLEEILTEVEEEELARSRNVAKVKREIVDILNSLTKEALDVEYRDSMIQKEAIVQKKREAEADPQTFNCMGSNCNVNNLGTINNGREENEASKQKHEKREAEADPQTFNCVGSNCGLNNFGTINNGGREGEEVTVQRNSELEHEHEKREAEANADPQTFNCVGANCNLNNAGVINNFGRGKREAEADPQNFNCVGSNCNLNNFGNINNFSRRKREIAE